MLSGTLTLNWTDRVGSCGRESATGCEGGAAGTEDALVAVGEEVLPPGMDVGRGCSVACVPEGVVAVPAGEVIVPLVGAVVGSPDGLEQASPASVTSRSSQRKRVVDIFMPATEFVSHSDCLSMQSETPPLKPVSTQNLPTIRGRGLNLLYSCGAKAADTCRRWILPVAVRGRESAM